jgi:transposase
LIAGDKAVVYLLDESRSGSVPQDFFSASTGTLMSDRYSAYKTLPDSIRKAWCWVHVRRDFLKIYDGVPKYRTWAKNWLKRITKLFVLQHRRLRLWQVNRSNGKDWIATTTELQEHVQLLEAEWRKELEKFPPTIKRTVLQSLKRHWQGLTLFLSDPRISLHNNRAERLLRFCVISRKNSYGSGAEWAGTFSAKIFSIFQTWLLNGLDPYALLRDYFERCSQVPGKAPVNVDDFLPWKMSEQRCKQFCLPASYMRPG